MTPFDLPSGNLFDLLHADLCGPAEVREHKTYLSKPPDEHPHRPHPHYVMSTLRRTSFVGKRRKLLEALACPAKLEDCVLSLDVAALPEEGAPSVLA